MAGGRPPGPSKATIERTLIAERITGEASMAGKKLAKEVLDDFMNLFAGMAAVYQPLAPGHIARPGTAPDEAKFEKYARLTVETARALAPFQSPTFRAIVIAPPPPERGMVRKRFTLHVFDNHRPDPKAVEGRAARKGKPPPAPDDEEDAGF